MTNLSTIRFEILQAVARYYVLTRMDLQEICCEPGVDPDGRRMRKHLTALRHDGLLNQTQGLVVFPERNGAPAPAYYPSRKGCEYLAAETGEEKWLDTCTLTPNWQNLHHWLRIAKAHLRVDQAVALQADDRPKVQVENWITEWTVANPEEREPEKRFSLFTLLSKPGEKRLVCAPDASCVITYNGFRKGVYWEFDRQTSGVAQISNSKAPGMARMAEMNAHLRHFPGVKLPRPAAAGEKPRPPFIVIHVSPSANRRDLVRNAFKGKPGDLLWRFAAWPEFTPESALGEAILHDVDGNTLPLIKRAEVPVA